ncbi:membrane protein [Salipiger pallidus]|uniref:Membrane protein n=1 Tax=Salipiger pallidus TaxID=1775170 RepID=A0A8J2ZIQ8_9RHOB|nr:tripartite tricarboxylate transporter TctB family protein [Salipiger pallidus]GGG69229.1 membrane protein [Salipiger pallidus]
MSRDLLGGMLAAGLVGAIGLFLVFAQPNLKMGTASAMGPGYFPRLVGYALLLVAALIALFDRSTQPEQIAWRPAGTILAAVLLFGLLVQPFGYIAAAIACTVAAALGDTGFKALPSLGVGLGIALFVWLVFDLGLGIRMPAVTAPWN